MFGGIIGILSLIGALCCFTLAGALIALHPWTLLVLVPMFVLIGLYIRKRLKHHLAKHQVVKASTLYPPGFYDEHIAPIMAKSPQRRAEMQAEAMRRAIERLHEPQTPGGHNRGHHG
jgi:hypothetical protein